MPGHMYSPQRWFRLTRLGARAHFYVALSGIYLGLATGASAGTAGGSPGAPSAASCVAMLVVPSYSGSLALQDVEAVQDLREDLSAIGCDVRVIDHLSSESELRAGLIGARRAVPGASTAMVFYLGHSVLREGRLQLLSTGARSRDDAAAMVPANALVEALRGGGDLTTLLVFDSCLAAIDRAPLESRLGLLPGVDTRILLSAHPGQDADDHDAFSEYFVAVLADPMSHGQDLRAVFYRASVAFREDRVAAQPGTLPEQMPYALTSWSPALYVDQVGGGFSRSPVRSAPPVAAAPPIGTGPSVGPAPAPVGGAPESGLVSIAQNDPWAGYHRAIEVVGGGLGWPSPHELVGEPERGLGDSQLPELCEYALPPFNAPIQEFVDWVFECASTPERMPSAVVSSGQDRLVLTKELLIGAANLQSAPNAGSYGRLNYGMFRQESRFPDVYVYPGGWCEVDIVETAYGFHGSAICHDKVQGDPR